MIYPFDDDDKYWDDHPATHFCINCADNCGGICTNQHSNEYEEVVPDYEEACVFYREEN